MNHNALQVVHQGVAKHCRCRLVDDHAVEQISNDDEEVWA
jgi:hypothetical protein